MRKRWFIVGNILILLLFIGGSILLITQLSSLSSQRASPENQPLAQVQLIPSSMTSVTEASTLSMSRLTPSISTTSAQTQTTSIPVASSPSPDLTLPLSAIPYQDQPLTGTWQVVDVLQFDTPDHPDCHPHFAPQGDRYLCYLVDENKRGQLWLASLSQGLEKLLVDQSPLEFAWGADGQYIIYAPLTSWEKHPYRSQADPVYRLDIQTGDTHLLGETTWIYRTQTLPTGQVSFINRYDITLTSSEQQARGEAATLIPIQEWQQQFRGQTDDNWWPNEEHLGGSYDVWYEFSPDGRYLLVAELRVRKISITLIEVASQTRTFVAEVAEAKDIQLFSWASDSQRFAYINFKDQIGPPIPEIWIMDVIDKQPQLIWQERQGGWYFDLTWLANQNELFVTHSPRGTNPYVQYDYYVLNLNKGNPQRLINASIGFSLFDQGHRLMFKTVKLDAANRPLKHNTWVATLEKTQP